MCTTGSFTWPCSIPKKICSQPRLLEATEYSWELHGFLLKSTIAAIACPIARSSCHENFMGLESYSSVYKKNLLNRFKKKNMLSDSFLDVSQFHTWWFNKCHLVSICFPGRNLPPGCTDFAHPAPITLPPQWRLSPSQLGTPNHLRKLIHNEMDEEMDKNSKFY